MRQNKWPSQYFAYILLIFQCLRKNFLAKDSSSNSLQNLDIFIILNNLHYFVTYDTIDLSKNYNFHTQHFCEFFLQHIILILRSLLLWMSLYSKNKIYHKMQREKLYNLHKKAYFNSIVFGSKKRKTLCNHFSPS